jgi:hypothetical protein
MATSTPRGNETGQNGPRAPKSLNRLADYLPFAIRRSRARVLPSALGTPQNGASLIPMQASVPIAKRAMPASDESEESEPGLLAHLLRLAIASVRAGRADALEHRPLRASYCRGGDDRNRARKRVCSQSTVWALSPTAVLPPFPFATNRTEPLAVVEAEHRKHAVVELRDPRSQRPGARAIPGGPVHRERRLDGDRRARAQPAALDRRPGPARPDHPRRPHPPAPTTRPPGRLTRTARAWMLHLLPAGPGNTPSAKRSAASARCPRAPDRSAHSTTTRRRRSHPRRTLGCLPDPEQPPTRDHRRRRHASRPRPTSTDRLPTPPPATPPPQNNRAGQSPGLRC